jgi:hypothetical protein
MDKVTPWLNLTDFPISGHDGFWDQAYSSYAKKAVELVHNWARDAHKDGWTMEPTYEGEGVNRATKLTITIDDDSFIVSILAREPEGGRTSRYNVSIHGWKNGYAFTVPAPYNRQKLIEASCLCGLCGEKIVGKIIPFSFAGQACQKCKEHAKKINDETYWD